MEREILFLSGYNLLDMVEKFKHMGRLVDKSYGDWPSKIISRGCLGGYWVER